MTLQYDSDSCFQGLADSYVFWSQAYREVEFERRGILEDNPRSYWVVVLLPCSNTMPRNSGNPMFDRIATTYY